MTDHKRKPNCYDNNMWTVLRGITLHQTHDNNIIIYLYIHIQYYTVGSRRLPTI